MIEVINAFRINNPAFIRACERGCYDIIINFLSYGFDLGKYCWYIRILTLNLSKGLVWLFNFSNGPKGMQITERKYINYEFSSYQKKVSS